MPPCTTCSSRRFWQGQVLESQLFERGGWLGGSPSFHLEQAEVGLWLGGDGSVSSKVVARSKCSSTTSSGSPAPSQRRCMLAAAIARLGSPTSQGQPAQGDSRICFTRTRPSTKGQLSTSLNLAIGALIRPDGMADLARLFFSEVGLCQMPWVSGWQWLIGTVARSSSTRHSLREGVCMRSVQVLARDRLWLFGGTSWPRCHDLVWSGV